MFPSPQKSLLSVFLLFSLSLSSLSLPIPPSLSHLSRCCFLRWKLTVFFSPQKNGWKFIIKVKQKSRKIHPKSICDRKTLYYQVTVLRTSCSLVSSVVFHLLHLQLQAKLFQLFIFETDWPASPQLHNCVYILNYISKRIYMELCRCCS